MENLEAIGINSQIENVLFGQPKEEKQKAEQKATFVRSNIDKVFKINGKKVYDVMMNEIDNESIYYNLRKRDCNNNIQSERKYYYPIQYANIELTN